MTAPSLGIVADDLSGAAECASHALVRVSRSIVVLAGGHADATTVLPDASRTGAAVANPALERVVVDGVLHVGGTPLHRTDLWAVEPTAAPDRVAAALHPLATVLVPHPVVTRGVAAVAAALVSAADAGL